MHGAHGSELLVHARGLLIIPVGDLPSRERARLSCGADDFVVSLPASRRTSKIIDADAAALLEYFRTPTDVDAALASFCDARGAARHEVAPAARGFVERLLRAGLLARAADPEHRPEPARFARGQRVRGLEVLRPLLLAEDTEVYLVRGREGHAVLKIEGIKRSPLASLRHEEGILRALDGPPAPRLLDAGRIQDRRFLLLEWCEGVSPARVARECRGLGDRFGLGELLVSIASAYADLHALGIAHGDVHPHNLRVAASGEARLLDFGLAGLASGNEGPPRAGVAYYFDPECAAAVLAGHAPPRASRKADQFSVAAMLYQLACDEHYCRFSLERDRMLRQIVETPPLPFAEQGVKPWPALESALMRALNKEPGDRHADMTRFVARLREAVDEAPPARNEGGAGSPSSRHSTGVPLGDLGIDTLLQASRLDGPWLANPLPAPTASVTYGAAGIAYGLYRIGLRHGDAELLALADVWSCRALREAPAPFAFRNDAVDLTAERIGEAAPYHTESGVFATAALIARARGDGRGQQRALDGFVATARRRPAGMDLTLGRSGILLTAALLIDALPEDWRIADRGLAELGSDMLRDLWEHIDAMPPIGESKVRYLGMAHGWAGYLYATLVWVMVTGQPEPDGLRARLDELARLAEPHDRGLRWPWVLPHEVAERPRTMPGWCNGSAGYVFLYGLAADVTGDPRYAEIAERAGWDAWDADQRNGSLCCGLAGRAYALLCLYRRGAGRAWRARAHELARRAGSDRRFDADYPHSLFRGSLGLSVLAADLRDPAEAAFPLFELERWSAGGFPAREVGSQALPA